MTSWAIRSVPVTIAVLIGLAIVLGRVNPDRSSGRTESAVRYQVLNKAHTAMMGDRPRLLDPETGRLETLPLSCRSSLDRASLSPWEEGGHRQVVGFGSDLSMIGMFRMSLPGGEVLDRVDFSGYATPTGPPCWFPGRMARVLYAGADGRLYRLDFERSGPDGELTGASETRPRALNWQAPVPAEGPPNLVDLSWSVDPRFGGRLLASLFFQSGDHGRYLEEQIWWLELDQGGNSIVAGGPVLEPAPGVKVKSRRFPGLVGDVGGEPALIYLAAIPRQEGYQLRVVPIRPGADGKAPEARESEARVLARSCVLAAPAASSDGRWVTILRLDGQSFRTERLSLDEASTVVARLR